MTKDEEIRMINEKLDFYVMEASDEEFDTEEVRKLVKRLDELDPIPLPWKSDEEALKDFWDYCEERQREERIIAEMKIKGWKLRVEKSVLLEKVCGKIYIREVYKSLFGDLVKPDRLIL